MDRVFPFGFPFPTAFYLTLYVVTLVIHVVFMNYVLAGGGYLAVGSFLGSRRDANNATGDATSILRDWMPFAVSATITAGVAPLLFLQILYQRDFYSANLLLFHRWMSIVPVLIVGFYLSYLYKGRTIGHRSAVWRTVIGVVAFACYFFTAYSWTENHLLSQRRDIWPVFYASERMMYFTPSLWLRLGLWVSGSVATMVTIVSWQLWFARRHGGDVREGEARRAATLALCGIGVSVACAAAYTAALGDGVFKVVTGALGAPYLVAAMVGLAVQAAVWIAQRRSQEFRGGFLAFASAGALLSIIGMTVVREAIRLAGTDVATLYPQHAADLSVGGLPVFLAFFAINAVVVGLCFRLVHRGRLKTGGGA